MRRPVAVIAVLAGLVAPSAAQAQESEVVTLLRELVQVNTSNPPGNEARVAELLAPRLRDLGFEVDVIPTPTPGKAHLVARLRAANATEPPILLAGHADTVGVEPDLWTFDPFGGTVSGDYLLGRGSLDFKGGLAAFTVAAMGLVRSQVPLKRDVILLAVPFRLANRLKARRYGELFNGLVRDIYVPTIIDSGFRSNVLPGTAVATVNMRMLPGTHPRPMIRRLRRVIGDRDVTVEPIVTPPSTVEQTLDSFDKRAEQAPSSTDTDLYRSLARQGRAQWPGVRVTPALFEAGTDAVPWRERGIPVYGVYPYPIARSDLLRMHGNDERVPVSGLEQGTDWISRVLVDVAAAQ